MNTTKQMEEVNRMLDNQRLYEVRLKNGAESNSICSSLKKAGMLESEVLWVVPKLNGTVSLNSSAKAADLVRTFDSVDAVVEVKQPC